jgi:hypothetical protein
VGVAVAARPVDPWASQAVVAALAVPCLRPPRPGAELRVAFVRDVVGATDTRAPPHACRASGCASGWHLCSVGTRGGGVVRRFPMP